MTGTRRSVATACLLTGALLFHAASSIKAGDRYYVIDVVDRLQAVVSTDGTVIVYSYDAAGNRLSRQTTTGGLPNSVWALIPGATGVGEELEATIAGDGFETATAVVFSQVGLTAEVRDNPTRNLLPITVTVDTAVPSGAYPFTIERSTGGELVSGPVVLVIGDQPYLETVSPDRLFQGETVGGWTLSGGRLQRTEAIAVSGDASTGSVVADPSGTSVTARLQVGLTASEGKYDVRAVGGGETSNAVPIQVFRHAEGLLGDYYDSFELGVDDLPIIPSTFPFFRKSDLEIDFGQSTFFDWRPCGFTECVLADFTVQWNGFIYLDEPGEWTLGVRAVDATRVRVDGQVVAQDPGVDPTPDVVTGAFVAVAAGSYPIVVEHGTPTVGAGVDLLAQGPSDTELKIVQQSFLWHKGIESAPLTPVVAVQSASYFNPEPLPLSPPPDAGIGIDVVSFAVGPTVLSVEPSAVSRSATFPVTLTINGWNLGGANGLLFTPADGVIVGLVGVNGSGTTVTAEITIEGDASTVPRRLQVQQETVWLTPKSPQVQLEVIP